MTSLVSSSITLATAANTAGSEAVLGEVVCVAPSDAGIAPAATPGSNIGSPVTDIIAIREDQKVWVSGIFARSNADLYALLARCLDAFQRMRGKKHLIVAFDAECSQAGLKFNSTTSLLGRIVRYVFGNDRKRSSAYATALEVAVAEDPNSDPTKLHLWIAAKGGVEEIRKQRKTGKTSLQRQEDNVAVATASFTNVTPFSVIESNKIDTTEGADFVVAIARMMTNGMVAVVGFVEDKKVVSAALAAYGKKEKNKKDADARTSEADQKVEALVPAAA